MNDKHALVQLSYNTYRIEAKFGDRIVPATGFCLNLLPAGEYMKLVMVTCRHSIEGADSITFLLRKKNADGKPINEAYACTFEPKENSFVFYHPNKNIDLAVIFITPILNFIEKTGQSIYSKAISIEMLFDFENDDRTHIGDDVVMIGYPNGLWDEVNNLPLVKRGSISTHPQINFNGKPEFVIDIPTYYGNSGSPILTYSRFNHLHVPNSEDVFIMPAMKLLGVMYESEEISYMIGADGANFPILNVGKVLKSSLIMDFIPLINAVKEYHFRPPRLGEGVNEIGIEAIL